MTPEEFTSIDLQAVTSSRRFTQFRNQVNRSGIYYCSSTGEHVAHESYAELVVATMIDFEVRPALLRAQPFQVHIGKRKDAHPDYIYRDSTGSLIVVEVKPKPVTDDDRLAQFATIRTVLAGYGLDYLVLPPTGSGLYKANLMWLAQFRRPTTPTGPDQTSRRHLDPSYAPHLRSISGSPIGK